MPKTHKIRLTVKNDKTVTPDPDPCTMSIKVDDHLTFESSDGSVEIDFGAESVLSPTKFGPGSMPIKAEREGEFVGRCSITLPSGEKVGWTMDKTSGVKGKVDGR